MSRDVPTIEQQIDDILGNFDFAKVVEVMRLLKWGWVTGKVIGESIELIIPDEKHLRRVAREVLEVAALKPETIGAGTGGLTVNYHRGFLSLYFVVTEWGCGS